MTITQLSEREFLYLVYLPIPKMWQYLLKMTPMQIMIVRRNMQISLSRYSKGKSQVDMIQLDAIGRIQYIENYCRRRYFKDMMAEIKRKYPQYTEAGAKEATKDKWEKFVVKMSY